MNENPKPRVLTPPNPITQAAHRKQTIWQIWVPFAIVVVLVLLSAVFVVIAGFRGTGDTVLWANISVIWLIVPMLFLTIIFIAVTAGLVVLLFQALRYLPSYSRQLQDVFTTVSFYVRKYSDVAVEPFLKAHSFSASIRALRRNKTS